jgi:hypothetical protein
MSSTDKWNKVGEASVLARKADNTFKQLIQDNVSINIYTKSGGLLFEFGSGPNASAPIPPELRVELEHYLTNLINYQIATIVGVAQELGYPVQK